MAREKIAKPKKFRQNTEMKQHFHPRWLARAVAHSQMARDEIFGVNWSAPGHQSIFSKNWRRYAERFSKEA